MDETCIDFIYKGTMPFSAYTVSSRIIEGHGISICLHSAVVGMLNSVAQQYKCVSSPRDSRK